MAYNQSVAMHGLVEGAGRGAMAETENLKPGCIRGASTHKKKI
jgi:hypothetical protein